MRSTPRWRRLGALACAAALVLSLVPGTAAAAGPAQSRNIHKNDYTTWSKPVTSYLYEHNGGLTRVEYTGGQIVVEDYDSSFALQSSRTVPMELSLWGGFFAGEDYNFLIFGQSNPSESDSAEVIRVVKYDKDWNRLGQASLRGANTTVPFDAGSLRCDEYGGYLYLRTSHEMYTSDDGLNHQSNLTMAVRQSDMSITDSYYDVMNISYGYVSHSFNQFVIVDEDGHLVALDHGDAYPRSVVFTKYYADAGTGRFTGSRYGQWCSYGDMLEFAGATGANATGGSVGGLAETRDCYIMAYSYNGTGQGSGDRYPYYHYMDKASGRSWQVQINLPGCTTPVLAPTGLDGGYMLWNGKSGSTVSDTLYYLAYSADGQPGQYQTAQAPLSDCQPIPWEDGVVWYVTDGGAPTFYTLDGSGVTAHPAGASAPEPTPTPTPTPTLTPTPTPTPTPGADADSLSCQLGAPTVSRCTALKEDGSLWVWSIAAESYGYDTPAAPVQVGSGYIAAGYNWGVKEDHSLWMWGAEGLITGRQSDQGSVSEPVRVMDGVRYASGSDRCMVALKTDGTLWGWGACENLTGEHGENILSSQPRKLLDGVKQAQCTGWGWMALKEDGSLWAAGISNHANLNAQAYTSGNQLIPLTQVMDGVAAFSVDWQNTLVIKEDGSLWSWGDSLYGQIGNGGGYTDQRGVYYWQDTPVKILDDVVYAQAGYTSYAITSDGTLYGWGQNDAGQLGFSGGNFTSLDSRGEPCQSTPIRITDHARAVVSFSYGVGVLKEDGSLWVCGDNTLGTLGLAQQARIPSLTQLLDGVMLPGQAGQPEQPGQPEPTPDPDPEPDPGQAASFTDVPASAWYAEYAGTAASAGLMNGTGSNRFSPSQTLSVAEVVTLAARLCAGEAGETVPASGSGQPWYRGAYDYCVDSGLFTAAEVPLSAMNSPATRFQMVDILDRAVPDSEKAAIHSDVTVPDLAQSAPYGGVVYRWYRAGITQGDQNGNFNGSSHITRAETAAILCRLAGLAERV